MLLSSLTTMIGFGALGLMGQWGAVSGIGVLLVIGIGACFVATVLLLPAVLGNRAHVESATAQPSLNKGA